MIFWSIPSVGQMKPETIFGEEDHFGFIQTLIGESYDRSVISQKCVEYYQKNNQRYWDQIITLVNALGMKQLDAKGNFLANPLLTKIAAQYDSGNELPAKALFDYLLCMWQYPHPILTRNNDSAYKELGLTISSPRSTHRSIKPYQLILSILSELYETGKDNAYLKVDEFYWLGYSYYKNSGVGFTTDGSRELALQILKMRRSGGWRAFEGIRGLPKTSTHLSYPKGFLRNSSVLSPDGLLYGVGQGFFMGLLRKENIKRDVESLIEACSRRFDFDVKSSHRDQELAYDYSAYLYDGGVFSRWLEGVSIYSQPGFNADLFTQRPKEKPSFKDSFAIQLQRLQHLEKTSISRRRTEQHILRKYLAHGQHELRCAICAESYPIDLIATAHIKPRRYCSDEEKRDVNVVMPACHLGCDKLFESGYVVVSDGIIHASKAEDSLTDDLRKILGRLHFKECTWFNDSNSKYFAFHARQQA